MGENVVDPTDAIPALPSFETSIPLPGPFRLWFDHGAARAGAVLALSPVAFIVTFISIIAVLSVDLIALVGLLLYVLFGLMVVLLLAISSLRARRVQRSLLRDAHSQFAPKLQSAKDWYLRGDITEGEYDQLRALIEATTSDRSPGLIAATAARTLRSFLLMLSLLSVFLLPITFLAIFEIIYNGESQTFLILLALLSIDASLIALVVLAWRTAYRAGGTAKFLDAQTLKRLEHLETDILRTARTRRVGGASSTSGYGAGPSFRSFTGR